MGFGSQDGSDAAALSPRQARIVAQLARLVSHGAADFFHDACRMLTETPPHPSATHLISHALREADSALRYVLEAHAAPQQAGKVEESACDACGHEAGGHLHSVRAACQALDLADDHPTAVFWREQTVRGSSSNLAGRAHRHALERPRPLDSEFLAFFTRMEDLFDLALGRFEYRYADVFDRLDLLLAAGPSAKRASELRQRFPANPVTRQRFFSRASAAWIGPLTKKGFFQNPPVPRHDPTDGSLDVPAWPESEYLARAAAEVPDAAVEAVLGMEPTQNSRVLWDLTRLALALPPQHAVRIAPVLVAALPGPYGVIAADQVGDLAVHLANGGHRAAAIDLLRAVLAEIPGRDAAGVRGFDYVRVVRESVPAVARVVGGPIVDLLIDRLVTAASADRSNRSQLWRPAIEPDTDRRRDTDVRNALADVLIEVGIALHDAGVHPVRDTVAALTGDTPDILPRVRLHLLRSRGQDAPELVGAQLRALAARGDDAVDREYLLLAAAGHQWLPPSDVDGLLELFDHDPDTTAWQQRLARPADGAGSGEDLLRSRVDRWRRNRYAALASRLDDARRARYEALVAEYGPAPDLSVPPPAAFALWSGEDVEAPELQALTADAAAQLLRGWQPPQDWRQLGRTSIRPALAVAAKTEAARWSAEAAAFIGLPHEFVTPILDGFWQAASADVRLDWTALGTFLAWVDEQAAAELAAGATRRQERLWRTARYAAMRLCTVYPDADPDRIPADVEPALWSIITAACTDPDPYAADAQDDGQADLASLDAVRPEALRAAILYGLRAQRRSGSSDVPEVMEVLDAHVSPATDPALAVRAMFGQQLQALLRLNPDWTATNLDRFLPTDAEHRTVWRAAWHGHLSNRVLTDDAWTLLQLHYHRAVDMLDAGTTDEWESHRAQQLAMHLGNRYWCGQLSLDDPDRLLRRFYERAPTAAAGTIVDAAGRSFRRDEPLDPQHRERLVQLWQYRIDAVRHGGDPVELAGFDAWFVNGGFDEAWLLEQLHDALGLVPDLDLGVHVLRRLRTLAARHPHACLRVVGHLAGSRERYWTVARHDTIIRDIISTAATEDSAAAEARRLVSAFAADGFDFRDALSGDIPFGSPQHKDSPLDESPTTQP
ncbi:hypothetical protein [Micromonospora tulbaghiae]